MHGRMARGPDAVGDLEKLDRAMVAGVTFDDIAVRGIDHRGGKLGIAQQQVQRSLHLLTVTDGQIGARRK
jgi:hypothetical protein